MYDLYTASELRTGTFEDDTNPYQSDVKIRVYIFPGALLPVPFVITALVIPRGLKNKTVMKFLKDRNLAGKVSLGLASDESQNRC